MHKIHTCCVCVDRWSFVENNSLSLQKTTQNVLLTKTLYDDHQISTISLTTYRPIHILMHVFNEYFKPQNVVIRNLLYLNYLYVCHLYTFIYILLLYIDLLFHQNVNSNN